MRRLIPAAVLAGLLLGVPAWTLPAAADDELPPPAYPSGLPNPGDIGNDVPDGGYTPGPTFTITPSTPGVPGTSGTAAPTPGAPGTPGAPSPGTSSSVAPVPGDDPTGAAAPGAQPGAPPGLRAPVDGGSPAWLAVAAGLIVLLGLGATFGGILRGRVTRDAASR